MHTAAVSPRVQWSWLWSYREDLTWNLVPFWASLALGLALLGWWEVVQLGHLQVQFPEAATQARTTWLVMYLYGPLVDAPHLWATIARTYTDANEWAERRRLFIGSLVLFLVGPAAIVAPYALSPLGLFPEGRENLGWVAWSHFFTFYALYHINKQHWGFVSLYRRKNGESTGEYRVDRWFFTTAIWLPYAAWLMAPWFVDFDGAPFPLTRVPVFGTTLGSLAYMACHVLFATVCVAYAAFQWRQWRRGVTRNGPKLVYLATVIPIYYLTFALNPLLAAFMVLMTGLGHCAQYHKIVWSYGTRKYVQGEPDRSADSLPARIFSNVWLYVVLGVGYGLVTLQGPGAGMAQRWLASGVQSVTATLFPFVGSHLTLDVGLKAAVALTSGVRLHHFYVDSKIWRVGKSQTLAKNLNV